ncbi:MAG: 23S rRNA (pseudouridine(1915)-N(3))-methyltransferase RlmH [Bacilli bacterium]|nr:23S rRNA (pseudouridine(1915)-N(3))-methyltransferase RlmH [Bacilli bacterium]
MKLICVGKIKEKYLKEAINDYLKRLTKYIKLEVIELTKTEEIIKNIKDKDYVITLEIGGNQLDSLSFSKMIEKTLIENSNILFVIGDSDGINIEVRERSNYKLSFSNMTYPHQLFRLIFLEQLYRSFKIINNETYHK